MNIDAQPEIVRQFLLVIFQKYHDRRCKMIEGNQQNSTQIIRDCLSLLGRMNRAKEILDDFQKIPDTKERYALALREVGLLTSDRESKKKSIGILYIDLFSRYLQLTYEGYSKHHAVERLANELDLPLETLVVRLKQGRLAMLERDKEELEDLQNNSKLDPETKNNLISLLSEKWMGVALPVSCHQNFTSC